MKFYTFIRAVPLAVTVEAHNESEAWTDSGRRLDDWFADATESMAHQSISHDDDERIYSVVYHGEAIYPAGK